ncbi:TPD domain-containing protein [Archaeoglobus veneficus]|uniref:CDAN1-interacting nuclease 1 n=1 Tax=Archaeoglobus veneficus (strain DSM 11195 / SNP6) TaxID=693661 RepID=F2KPU2_ARCVS|nr:TPD domain-containing protein [Archaeoglobus veneficus]AEA46449.1 hypothetical protein Arcve_0417 [Archaeoglobus veneficus SNP6]
MIIEVSEFQRIRKELKSLRDLSRPGYPRGMLFTILSQKRVDAVKRYYPQAVDKLDEIASYWNENGSFPPWLRLTPVMRVRVLLKALGYSKAETGRILKDPGRAESDRIEEEVWRALFTDFIYSPLAVKHQFARGKLGEEIIRRWLEERGIEYRDEKDLRKEFDKTPDFYFDELVDIAGKEVKWIESKALFGDPRTHWLYDKKQFSRYEEMFGEGYVVYWFGWVKGLNRSILPYDFFSSPLRNALLDMRVYTAGGSPKRIAELAEKLDAFVVDIGCDAEDEIERCVYIEELEPEKPMRSKEFLDGMCRLIDCYSKGRILIASREKDWKKSHRRHVAWVLRNLGFDVIHV